MTSPTPSRPHRLVRQPEPHDNPINRTLDRVFAHLEHGPGDDVPAELKRTVDEQAQRIRMLYRDIDLLRDQVRERSLQLTASLTEKTQLQQRMEQQAGMLLASLRQLDDDCYHGRHHQEHPCPQAPSISHGLTVGALIAGSLARDFSHLQLAGRKISTLGNQDDLPHLVTAIEGLLETADDLRGMMPMLDELLDTLSNMQACLNDPDNIGHAAPRPQQSTTRLMGSSPAERIALASVRIRRMTEVWRDQIEQAQALRRALRDARRSQHERGHALIQARQEAAQTRNERDEARARLAQAEQLIAQLREERELAAQAARPHRSPRSHVSARRSDLSPTPESSYRDRRRSS